MAKKQKDVSRRQFFTSSMAGLTVLGASREIRKPFSPDDIRSPGPILKRTLGRTGIEIPVVSMGVMNASDPALIQYAWEKGIRHYDTAAVYQRGRNEEMLGSALKEMKTRDQAIIATKVLLPRNRDTLSDSELKAFVLDSAEQSLKRLSMDYVDILYLHNLSDVKELHRDGCREALLALKKDGKTRHIGFTTHSKMTPLLEDAAKSDFYDVILVAFNYSLGADKTMHKALTALHGKNIGLIAMKTQCSQGWYKNRASEEVQKFYEGTMMHSALLKWVLNNKFISTAIPGVTTFEQIDEDMKAAFTLEYTKEEKAFFEERGLRLSLGYCHQCTECVPTCPHNVDIPALMRTHMYAFSYGNFIEAHDTYDRIEEKRNLQACVSCRDCRAQCSKQIDISDRINRMQSLFA